MDDMFDVKGDAQPDPKSLRAASDETSRASLVARAARARERAEQATATGARSIHLEMAAGYDIRAAEAAAD